MAVATGMRQGELLCLQWGDVDRQSGHGHVHRQLSKERFAELKNRHSHRKSALL